ncbi:LytR/AlgR family response regulator transcription factor [Streptomyces aidingensis]|uniref:DNA-binding response regulator, LytR/AlgR family n=1 Tax=Streptomyces aidingensis TaxID=910347 RepID=A0A1I1E5G9_9ACTN|nr:LytTR family DNA-binding domain-containing protein [Streptomyces aidingensis]SFB82489.1 DNA-binding response regulator, LytR/AlgR family [Streptomyces aidingensis]
MTGPSGTAAVAEGAPAAGPGLRALVVEDETSTRQELAGMLERFREVGTVRQADSGEAAVRLIGTAAFDVVFLDISMPGLDGMEVARVLNMLSEPPAIVFVTASENHAVAAFGVGAADYLLKPVRPERLAEAVARVRGPRRAPAAAGPDAGDGPGAPGGPAGPAAGEELSVVQIETGRHTVFVHRDDIQYAEAHGDYVRLHTAEGVHLIRLSLSYLEDVWGPAGFVRAHRGYLVAVRWIRDLRVTSSSGLLACTPAGDVPVSRRHARALKERLLAAVRDAGQQARPPR